MNSENKRIRQVSVFYNQLINFFWSVLSFAPIVYFCYQYLPLTFLYIFLAISSIALCIPASLFSKLQISKQPQAYRRIGIRVVKKYTQDGDLVNRFIKSKYPKYKYVENRQSLKKVMNKSYINEKFHYMVFLFFLCTCIYALWGGLVGWSICIGITNVIYNLYPIFLQQYNRLRINQLMNRKK